MSKKQDRGRVRTAHDLERKYDLGGQKELMKKMREDVEKLTSKTDDSSGGVDSNEFATLRSDVSTLKSDVNTAKTDVSTLKSDVSTLKSDVSTLKSKATTTATDISTLKSDVSTLKSNVNTAKTDISTLKSDVNTLKNDVSSLKNSATSTDSGWIDCYLTYRFAKYSSSNVTLQTRKIGNIVHMRGVVKPTEAITPAGDSDVAMAIIQTIAHHPPTREVFICQGSGAYRFALSIDNDGYVYISRYTNSTTANMEIASGAWLPCFATWFVD